MAVFLYQTMHIDLVEQVRVHDCSTGSIELYLLAANVSLGLLPEQDHSLSLLLLHSLLCGMSGF